MNEASRSRGMTMASSGKSGAQPLRDQTSDHVEEPSMEEILASIKQIISDDEQPDDGLTERERYTHPTDPSNSNSVEAMLDDEIENAMALELGLEPNVEEKPAEPEVVEPETAAAATAVVAAPKGETLAQRAERVRNQVSEAGAGLSADERLEKYRVRGKLHMEQLLAKAADAEPTPVSAVSPASAAPQVNVAPQMTAGPILPTTQAIAQEMSSTMMSEKSKEIEAMLSDLMRPTIRQWLSDNLPSMVERLIREEIQAVSRGKKSS